MTPPDGEPAVSGDLERLRHPCDGQLDLDGRPIGPAADPEHTTDIDSYVEDDR